MILACDIDGCHCPCGNASVTPEPRHVDVLGAGKGVCVLTLTLILMHYVLSPNPNHNGRAMLCVGKHARKQDFDVSLGNQIIVNPHALPMYRQDTGNKRQKERVQDALPLMPLFMAAARPLLSPSCEPLGTRRDKEQQRRCPSALYQAPRPVLPVTPHATISPILPSLENCSSLCPSKHP